MITVGRGKEVPTFSQLDGAPPVAAAKPPSYSSAASSPTSPPSQSDEEHPGGEGAAPGRKTESDLGAGSLRRSESPPMSCSTSLSKIHLRYSLGHVTGFVQYKEVHYSSSSCDKSNAVSSSYVLNI